MDTFRLQALRGYRTQVSLTSARSTEYEEKGSYEVFNLLLGGTSDMSHRPRPLTSFLIEDILSTDESSRLNRSSLWTQKTDTGPQWDKYPGEVSKKHFQQSYLGVRKGN